MTTEIERKFLVNKNLFKPTGDGEYIAQGYLSSTPERTVRVRIKNNHGFLTIKGKNIGISRSEFEYEIPEPDARELLNLCEPSIIIKRRHIINVNNSIWEVDVFEGDNKGLIVAEIELQSEDEIFNRPDWLGDEVSNDARYYNSNLSKRSYNTWNK
ncbi:MAG: CYTH domain-containing protein [Selenomonadaceae bacterium]|nr:CYTH domain-containing protein [Selenomonadaceae bacterium]MBR1858927.1 CYTH domain-containing protein [Selenomonadaceae bacterium]